MNSQFFRQYIDLLNEQQPPQTPTKQETERRAKDLAARMGVAAPNLIDFEQEGGVPVRINGDRVPPEFYTADEKRLIATARTLSGGAAAAPPQRDGGAAASPQRDGAASSGSSASPQADDSNIDKNAKCASCGMTWEQHTSGPVRPRHPFRNADGTIGAPRKSQSSSSAPTGTQIQSDDSGYHLITTPDGKTVVAGPDDGKTANRPTGQSSTGQAQTAAGADRPQRQGPKVGYANPGTRAYQHWLNSKGVKVAIDGSYGPETQGAGEKLPKKFRPGGDPKLSYEENKRGFDEHMEMLSVGTAYNVIPAPGKPYVWLNSPIYLERMKKYGYDPKTGNPIPGGPADKPATGGGQSGSPGASTMTPEQKTKLVSSLGSIEAVLAKYKIKTNESIDPLDALVLENINQFTPAEQMQIWAALSEIRDISGDAAYSQMQKDMDARAARERVRAAYQGSQDAAQRYNRSGSDFVANKPQQQSRLSKFLGKLGGASGIGKRIAARAGASALAGPAAAIVGVGAAGWTAFEVGKALWDTFTKTELADLEPQDQEIIKANLQTILQFQKNPEMMQGLDPELKIRVERAMKGLDRLAVKAGSEEQAASPAAGSQVDQRTADRVRDASGPVSTSSQTSGIRIANEPVIPGQPLSNTQMRVMKMAMDMGNTYPEEIMAQYRRQSRDF